MASSKVKGMTIDLDVNANGINESLKSVNKELGSTTKELKQVEKGLKFDPSNVVLLSQKQKLLTDAIDKTSEKLQTLKIYKEQAEKEGGLDKNTKKYRDLERQIESTTYALKSFKDDQENVNKSLNESNNKLSSVGNTFNDVFGANLLSNVAIKGIEMLTNALIDLSGVMYTSVVDSGKFADDINTLTKQYNLSTKELQVFTRASELLDVDVNTIAKSMSKLTKNMTSTSSGVIDAFKQLGIQTKEADGSLRDSNAVFYETIDALSKISNETEQDSLALEIFGKSASELGTLINGGAEQLDQFNKYLEENNLILSQGELDQLNEMNDSLDTLGMTFTALKDKLSVELAPVLQPFIDQITQFLNDHQEEMATFVQNVADFIASQEFADFVKDVIDIGQAIADMIVNVVKLTEKTGLLKLAFDIVKGVVESIRDIVKDIINLLDGSGLSGGNSSYAQMARARAGISSGGFTEHLQSGGFGGIVLNNSFNISNGSNIDESVVKGWAITMVDTINEQLGVML